MYRNKHGFTLIEIIATLVIMSIVAAGVLYKAMNTDQIDLMAQVARIRNQVRYAQAMAMKRSEVWGMACFGGMCKLFKDIPLNTVQLPGEKADTISLADLGVSMNAWGVFFTKLGVPYKSYPPSQPVTLDNKLEITISGDSGSVTLSITPETGLIQ